ncbi:MAG: hypothetical protein HY047_00430 [Acidobacteria bacterium]|nr:hypothetical protein [Acidobacteriota bacterium]
MTRPCSRRNVNVTEAREHEEAVFRAAIDLEVGWSQLMERVFQGDNHPTVVRARERLLELSLVRTPGVVFLLLWRQFRWAATDLCRCRLTASFGYQRQQAEALALFFLLREDATLAKRWADVASNDDGRRFFAETRERVAAMMRRHELSEAYEYGSAAALHVRIEGATRGLRQIYGGVPTLVDAEIDPGDLYDYHSVSVGFLNTQLRIFRALDAINPERSFELPRLTREAFERNLRTASEALTRAYPSRANS